MRRAASGATDASLGAPLTAFEDADFSDDDAAEAVLSAAGAPNARRHRRRRHFSKLATLRILPWVALALIAVTLLLALPGGLGVLLCASGASPPPRASLSLIGLRGSEWPEPGNTLPAVLVGARLLRFVHIDLAASRDHVPVAVRGLLEHSTNGSGRPCIRPHSYISNLVVAPPSRDPESQPGRGVPCSTSLSNGTRIPCVYRVPTLSSVFKKAGADTSFVLEVAACDGPHRPHVCGDCTRFAEEVKRIASDAFVAAHRLVFTTRTPDAVAPFMSRMPDAAFIMHAGHEYAHYSTEAFVKRVVNEKWDGVAMSITLALWRPDLVRAIEQAEAVRTSKPLVAYAKPVQTEWNLKIASCAGIGRHVVADPRSMAKLLGYKP